MDIGNKIKKYREKINLSQEELSLKLFVSRQTLSNWENNKYYPDIKSIIMLCNIFDVSFDDFIKGDLLEMKKMVKDEDKRQFDKISTIFTIELIVTIVASYPLLKFLKMWGIVILAFLFITTMVTALKIEKLKKQYDIETYREIIAFSSNEVLSHDDKIKEIGKRPYQKVFLAIGSGLITLLIMALFSLILS